MISDIERVKTILEGKCQQVYYQYPSAWSTAPVVSWRESQNRCIARADGMELMSEVQYTIDVWGFSPSEICGIADRIDFGMQQAGYKRVFAADLFETATRYHHRTMRFRAVLDTNGRVYQ